MPPARPTPPSNSPPLPLGRYVHLLVGVTFGAEVAESDVSALSAVERLAPSPAERAAVRDAAVEARQAYAGNGDDLLDVDALPTAVTVVVGLALAAQARHLLSYWGPMLDMGRRGEFTVHAPELRRAAERLERVERALRRRGEPVGDETARRLVALLAEVEAAMPVEAARPRPARPEPSTYTPPRREARDPADPASLASSIASAPPPTRLTQERKQAEERRRAVTLGLLSVLGLVLVVFLAGRMDRDAGVRPDGYYKRYGPVVSVERRPLLYEVEMAVWFSQLPRSEKQVRLGPLVRALREEDDRVGVIVFETEGREFARWSYGDLEFP